MYIEDIFNQLRYGEFRNLPIVKRLDSDPYFTSSERNQVIPHIIQALRVLHTRFAIREEAYNLPLVEGIYSYDLSLNDLLKISRIYGVLNAEPYEVSLNKVDSLDSIRTPSYNHLDIPSDPLISPWLVETSELNIRYRADHPVIDIDAATNTPESVVIELPPAYLEPLLYYIASRYISPIGMNAEFHEGNNYAAKYERSCQRLEQLNMEVDADSINTKLTDRGFV